MTPAPYERIDYQTIDFFRELMRHRYSGMILLYMVQRKETYPQELSHDLRASDVAIKEGVQHLLQLQYIEAISTEDKRMKKYRINLLGLKVAHALTKFVQISQEAHLQAASRKKSEGTSE